MMVDDERSAVNTNLFSVLFISTFVPLFAFLGQTKDATSAFLNIAIAYIYQEWISTIYVSKYLLSITRLWLMDSWKLFECLCEENNGDDGSSR